MKRWVWTAAVLVMLVFFVALPAVSSAPANKSTAQAARLVRLRLQDGSTQLVRLDGVGCDASICSRIAVNSRAVGNVIVNRTRFETMAAIREIADGSALFVFKDGSSRRVVVLPDNRVLYVSDSKGRSQRIALRRVQSIDFDAKDSQ